MAGSSAGGGDSNAAAVAAAAAAAATTTTTCNRRQQEQVQLAQQQQQQQQQQQLQHLQQQQQQQQQQPPPQQLQQLQQQQQQQPRLQQYLEHQQQQQQQHQQRQHQQQHQQRQQQQQQRQQQQQQQRQLRQQQQQQQQQQQPMFVAQSGSCKLDNCGGASASEDYKLVWRRRQTEHPSTEGSLRALLNKLAPSRVLGCLATQVAGHLVEDEAPDQLARQLVERAQAESLFASTYAKLCSELVRVRSGFVFYKHLMTRCRAAFSSKVRQLIVEATLEEDHDATAVAAAAAATTTTTTAAAVVVVGGVVLAGSAQSSIASNDVHRHRLNALMVFLCHLFLEGLLSFDQLHQDYLRQLDSQLPDRVALECLCLALKVAGRRLEEQRSHWVLDVIRQAQDAVHGLQQERNLRLTFMVRDLVELHQRNWQQREPQIPSSPIEHAEP